MAIGKQMVGVVKVVINLPKDDAISIELTMEDLDGKQYTVKTKEFYGEDEAK